MSTLSYRLKNKEIIILDGGVSTEIQQRGVSWMMMSGAELPTGRTLKLPFRFMKIISVPVHRLLQQILFLQQGMCLKALIWVTRSKV